MLTKDLLRVSRRGGDYRPQFVDGHGSAADLPARVIGVYQGHVGHRRADLDEALTELERDAEDFKLVRGFAKLLDRDAAFETRTAIEPERARRVAFGAAEAVGVVTEAERTAALDRAADRLDATSDEVVDALYADLEDRQVLSAFDPRWSPEELIQQYNLSLAMTALFDATEVRIRSSDPRGLISAVKRLGLMYDIRKSSEGRVVVVTGPDGLFRSTRRYGTRFARLLRSIAGTGDWHLEATIDDRGTERTMELTDDDPVGVPGTDPVETVTYDSRVEADFATRFESLDFDWTLVREPEPLAAGARVMIPDFAFDYEYGEFRVFFEIMGFWTPEYVTKKLGQLESLEDVELLVAVDESLGVGEAVEARDHRVVTYTDSIRLRDVRNALRRYEDRLVAESVAALPDELRPDPDAIALEAVADEYGVSEAALRDVEFPEHRRIGRTLVRPTVLEELAEVIEPGMSLGDADERLAEWGISETSGLLAHLGYEVAWEGLSGGTIRRRDAES